MTAMPADPAARAKHTLPKYGCDHTRIRYKPAKRDDGVWCNHWVCQDCHETFVPSTQYQRAMQCGYHLCTMVADNAVAAVADMELREVAREKIREHITKAFEHKAFGWPKEEA